MTLTAHRTPFVEPSCGKGIGAGRERVRVVHEQWFPRTAGPGEDLTVEDRKLPERLRLQSRGLLGHWELDCLVDRVNTVLSEMVTNALVHGGGDLGFRIIRTNGGVRVEVADRSTASAHVVHADPDDEHGRGLFLVHAFSDSWGIRAREGRVGKWTWAFLATPSEAEGTR
ncbi:ATP-binding protein [Streptomyces sp. NPDC050485]|uniref:ATP-binding protein n=1 Tax=Streptomyces sp. NPDC050485 TaxID=3365617 RepID=UPI0037A7F5AD